MKFDEKSRIAVVVGGPSTEAAVSRRTGAAIAAALQGKGYHLDILELEPRQLAQQLKELQIDVVFNALHGKYGEDGVLQGLCEMLEIPYTGSGVMASAVGIPAPTKVHLLITLFIPTAPFAYYFSTQSIQSIQQDVIQHFSFPVVVKSAGQGSSIGTVNLLLAEQLPYQY